MADNERAEGGEGEAASAKRSRLKLIIAAIGFLAILGGGTGWFVFMRGHGDEHHAEAPPPKPPSFVDVPDMLVIWSARPASACNISRSSWSWR